MLNLFRAEWQKIAGNRAVSLSLIWIFPAGAVAYTVIMAVVVLASPTARALFASGAREWTSLGVALMVDVWNLPNNPLGRVLLLGFAAVVFGGEYQWRTWKNIVPRNRRVALILSKFVAVGVFVVLAFVSMSVIMGVGTGIAVKLAGGEYGPKLTGDVLASFAGDYALQATLTFISTIITAGYAALAGMITRSILGGALVGLIATIGEGLSLAGLGLIGYFLNIRRIVNLYRLTPTYNLANVSSWINNGSPNMMLSEYAIDSLTFSLVVLTAWVLGLMALTALLFQRQDITS